jgi:3-oxocholest-4-en-26-oate---CoA ligase
MARKMQRSTTDSGREFSFSEILSSVALRVPDRPAIVWRDSVRSYRDLLGRTRRFANVLVSQGLGTVRPRSELMNWESGQDHVAVCMRNRPEWLEVLLGCAEARSVAFNVNYRYVEDEFVQVLKPARPSAIVFESAFADVVAKVLDRIDGCKLAIQIRDNADVPLLEGAIDFEDALADVPDTAQPAGQPSADDLYLLFTGGTTGIPKGVLWRQADIFVAGLEGRVPGTGLEYCSLDELVESIGPKVRTSLPAPPFMHGSAQWSALASLFSGGCVVIQDNVDRLDPDDIWQTVQRHGVKLLLVAGNAFGRPLLDSLRSNTFDTSSLRVIVTGAVAMSPAVKQGLLQLLPGVTIVDSAGASESGSSLVVRSVAGGSIKAGMFAPAAGTLVLNAERSAPLAAGDPRIGWLARAGRVPLGYLNDPEQTLITFPEVGGERVSLPGDRARASASGEIELLGRDSVTINTGGEKVFAEEVEEVIGRHPSVYDVVVAGRPSDRWGQEIGAVVQLRFGATASLEELRAEAAKHLARYKLPKIVVFVRQVPRSAAGKADYRWAESILVAGVDPSRSA